MTIESEIVSLVETVIKELYSNLEYEKLGIQVKAELPRKETFGDISVNIAMRLAGMLKMKTLEVAETVAEGIRKRIEDSEWFRSRIVDVKAISPGFINFFLNDSIFYETLSKIEEKMEGFGSADSNKGKQVIVEFVSANPTGPLTIAHARQAAVGDSLARILAWTGFDVAREYYLNDKGLQIEFLGISIKARYLELLGEKTEFPSNGYKGAYIFDIARSLAEDGEEHKEKEAGFFSEYGSERILAGIKKDLEDFGVNFDSWRSQASLEKDHKVEEVIALLKEQNMVYEEEGAVWLKSSRFGDEKDRVLIKKDGSFTYISPDIAYHLEKIKRGFSLLIDLWGPDHHGYIPRLKAAISALGFDKDILKILIVQLSTLYKGKEVLKMSTREGEFITMRQVMDEVGRDAARFFFLMRKVNSHLDFDLELAKKESPENPVYYLQYAHARICNIMRFAKEQGIKLNKSACAELLKEEEEIRLIKFLRRFPQVVSLCSRDLEPYSLVPYLMDLASRLHSFYDKHRVVGENRKLTGARLRLINSVRTVLANGLCLLGVQAPERM